MASRAASMIHNLKSLSFMKVISQNICEERGITIFQHVECYICEIYRASFKFL